MELQSDMAAYERTGVRVFAISYDSVEVLADFAGKHSITFPLLSDAGSATIRAIGLYAERIAEQQAFYGRPAQPHHFGVPYPGFFVLDEQGIVVSKVFEQSYRVRPTAAALEEIVLGATPPAAALTEARSPEVEIRAWMGTALYRPYQRLHLHVDLQIAPGLHVYAPPASDGLIPLSVVIAPFEGLEVGPIELPEPRQLSSEELGEAYLVYDGFTSITVPLAITSAVPETILDLTVAYQACSEYACYPPANVKLAIVLKGEELVRE